MAVKHTCIGVIVHLKVAVRFLGSERGSPHGPRFVKVKKVDSFQMNIWAGLQASDEAYN